MDVNNKPIGVFDSGVGGLSVWLEIDRLLPNESTVYYADNANCPYGEKTRDEVIEHSAKATQFLINKGCKIVVVACNTATSQAIDYLRKTFGIPFVGIVPAVKPAAINSKTGVIAILATAGTLKSKKFNDTKREFSGKTEVILVEGGELVDIVENGLQGTKQSEEVLRNYINPLMEGHIDHLVLGCTHFPFLIEDIRKITGDSVVLDDPAPAIAKRTKYILEKERLMASPDNQKQIEFFASGNIETLKNMVQNSVGIKSWMKFTANEKES
ncbi:MAG: glutamate racemase [Prevotellaceae bacterium]|jgi:glutamate racemase|nr:glutamate racemase [Prevotellaceae bacterium]